MFRIRSNVPETLSVPMASVSAPEASKSGTEPVSRLTLKLIRDRSVRRESQSAPGTLSVLMGFAPALSDRLLWEASVSESSLRAILHVEEIRPVFRAAANAIRYCKCANSAPKLPFKGFTKVFSRFLMFRKVVERIKDYNFVKH